MLMEVCDADGLKTRLEALRAANPRTRPRTTGHLRGLDLSRHVGLLNWHCLRRFQSPKGDFAAQPSAGTSVQRQTTQPSAVPLLPDVTPRKEPPSMPFFDYSLDRLRDYLPPRDEPA